MAWYDPGTDFITTVTSTIWNSLLTYLRNHKAEHITGGIDPIPVATTLKTGLCPVLDGDETYYLDGSGNWTVPAATGAVMETDYNAFTVLAADTDNTPAPLTVGASTIVGRASTGGIVALTKLQGRTLLAIDAIHLYPMGAIVPTTSPATVDQAELSNGLNYVYGEYSYTAYNVLQWMITLPVELAAATFTIAVEWLTTSASANTVYWDIYGVRVGNGTTRNIDLLTKNLVTVTDTNTGASYTNWSDESAAVTITGTGNTIHLQVSRDYTTDTLDETARLISVRLTPVI